MIIPQLGAVDAKAILEQRRQEMVNKQKLDAVRRAEMEGRARAMADHARMVREAEARYAHELRELEDRRDAGAWRSAWMRFRDALSQCQQAGAERERDMQARIDAAYANCGSQPTYLMSPQQMMQMQQLQQLQQMQMQQLPMPQPMQMQQMPSSDEDEAGYY